MFEYLVTHCVSHRGHTIVERSDGGIKFVHSYKYETDAELCRYNPSSIIAVNLRQCINQPLT